MALPALLARAFGAYVSARHGHGDRFVGAKAIGYATGYGVNAIAAPTSSVATREIGYRAEALATNHIADPSQIMQAFWQGRLDQAQLQKWLGFNGVPFVGFDGPQGNQNTEIWRNVLLGSRPHFDVSTVVSLYQQDVIDRDKAEKALSAAGFTSVITQGIMLRDRGWYSADVATSLWQGGFIGEETYRSALKRGGISEPEAQARLMRLQTPLQLEDVSTAYHLRTLEPDIVQYQLQLHGYGTEEQRSRVLSLPDGYGSAFATTLFWRNHLSQSEWRRELSADGVRGDGRQDVFLKGARPIPGAETLVSLAVRESWDDATALRFGYDQELPAPFVFWMRMQGMDWTMEDRPDVPQGVSQVSWPKAYWRAHWQPMSPTQAYDAFHSLTPARVAELQQQIPGLRQFTWEDLATALKINDYPPVVRSWIAATSFSIPDIRLSRQIYAERLRPAEWFREQLTRRGYSRADADAMIDLEDRRQANTAQAAAFAFSRTVQGQALKTAIASYRAGAITDKQCYQALIDGGVNDFAARQAIAAANAAESLALIKEGTSRLKRAYLAGEFSPAELPGQLGALGLSTPGIVRYVARFNLARSQRRRMASTAQIVRWVASGQLNRDVGALRLENLGWTKPDVLLLIADAQAASNKLHAAAEKATEMATTKKQRELERVQKEAIALAKSTQARLRTMTPIATLEKWVCNAQVSPEWARARLLAMGIDPPIAQGYLDQWRIASEASGKCKDPLPVSQDTAGDASAPQSHPVPSGTIPQPTGIETLVGGTKQIP